MTAALEGGEWSAARPDRTLPPGKSRYLFYRRLGRAKNTLIKLPCCIKLAFQIISFGLTSQYGAVEHYNHSFKKGYESISDQNWSGIPFVTLAINLYLFLRSLEDNYFYSSFRVLLRIWIRAISLLLGTTAGPVHCIGNCHPHFCVSLSRDFKQ